MNQEVQQSAEEVRAAMNRVKTGKAVGPDDISRGMEVFRRAGCRFSN